MYLLIKSGSLVTSEKTFVSDILIKDGLISAIGENLETLENTKVIDAKGHFIFPGAIDPHVHMCLPTPAGPSSDDFVSGSLAAINGGTTTILDFVTPRKGQSLVDALEKRIAEAKGSVADYSFHVSPVEWRSTTEAEIEECFKRGISSFKVYMAYKNAVGLNDEDFLKVLQTVGRLGGLVTVHCELGDEIDVLRDKFVAEGHVSPEFHAKSRPPQLESEAVKRAIEMASKAHCPLYIVHVSAKESLQYISEAQKNGQPVFGETCPHYLLLDESKYLGNFNDTVAYVISPPLRQRADQEALWKAINDETVVTFGTDHCPFNLAQKSVGIHDFRRIPNGAGSVEHRLSLIYTYGVLTGKISLNQMVDICCTQPAKVFGLWPQKGDFAIGSDADLVIWNSEFETKISAKTDLQHCDLNMYEGFSVKGRAEYVIARGKLMLENGALLKDIEQGRFLKR